MAKVIKKSIKGVSLEGLTDRQKVTMSKHSVHHTKKHMQVMANAMRKGKTFTEAHKMAMKKVGK
tara:strand:- start:1648 stop:1839 length:192 start_codon:yes stop_codon:yes gene_type:complete